MIQPNSCWGLGVESYWMYHQEYGLIMVDMGWGWVLLLVKFQFSKVFF